MLNKRLRAVASAFTLALALAGAATTAYAAPSVNDVEAAIARNDLQGAQSMLSDVIKAHPQSARARYLDAQVLERNHRYGEALTEIQAARNIDPAIGFTDRGKFEAVERRIQSEAGGGTARTVPQVSTGVQQNLAETPHRGPSPIAWLGLVIVIAAVIALIAWSMRRRRNLDDAGGADVRRDQLGRATRLMDAIRATKLDLKLSTSDQKTQWIAEAEELEAQLRGIIDTLSGSQAGTSGSGYASSPQEAVAYQLETLEPQVARLQALAAGRPDPGLHTTESGSRYAAEADQLARNNAASYPYGAPQAPGQPPVVVQQPSSGLGAGLGGLAGGILLGEMLGGHRERDVIVEHDRDPGVDPNQQAGNNPFDFGNGGDSWGGGDTQIDAGNDDGWDDNNT